MANTAKTGRSFSNLGRSLGKGSQARKTERSLRIEGLERRELLSVAPSTVPEDLSYPIVDTGQTAYYDNAFEIEAPAEATAFYGQDAQYDGYQPDYTTSADGLTVLDNVTSLTWTQGADWNDDGAVNAADKFTYSEAQDYVDTLNALNYGGFDDWRVPSIKELYSLIDYSGTDPNPMGLDTSGLVPFIDDDVFEFAYGDTSSGERIIDSQWVTSTLYVSTVMNNDTAMFGVNFADGRIKGYPAESSGGGFEKTFYARFCRGNTDYGTNVFSDNGDGTVMDNATGLMWSQSDSGVGMNWEDALAWVQQMNDENHLGHDDWRLPNAKELQSLVDYTRSPDTTDSAAIDPVFDATQITNEAGEADYPFYWSGTTFLSSNGYASRAVYVAFGEGLGSMDGWNVIDVHGAGSQRSDPKAGNPANYPTWGNGPQGDVQRVFNFVRLVRDGEVVDADNMAPTAEAGGPYEGTLGANVPLDGSASADSDGSIVQWDWDLDGDGQYDDASGVTATYQATSPGIFTIGMRVTDNDGAQDFDTATVAIQALQPTPLGPVDDMMLSDLDLSSGDLAYSIEPAHDGLLTLISSTPGLRWQLCEANTMTEIAPSDIPDQLVTEGRDDYPVAGKGAYLLRLSGQATDADLRLVNLVNHAGPAVDVYGTAGEDAFAVNSNSYCHVTINGVDYFFDDAEISTIRFDGAAGNDQASIAGTPAGERIDLSPSQGGLSRRGYSVSVVNTSNIQVDGGGGPDVAYLIDSDGDDLLVADSKAVSMTGVTLDEEAFNNGVVNVPSVHAYGLNGGFDRAELTGTAGKRDSFKGCFHPEDANQQYGKLYTDGTLRRAKFFEEVVAHGNEGDLDRAVLVSTTGADTLEAGPEAATLNNTDVTYAAINFGVVQAYAAQGGDDTLILSDSAGDDRFRVLPGKAEMSGPDYRVVARAFDHVIADAATFGGDRDEVRLYDSPEDDLLTSTVGETRMTGGVDFTARGFQRVKVYSLYAGDRDAAAISGSSGDDTLYARSNSNGRLDSADEVSLLAATPEGRTLLKVVAFSDVVVDSRTGNDAANVPDDLAALDYVLRMEGQWDD